MFDSSWNVYIKEFLKDISSISNLVKEFFTSLFISIPAWEKLFQIAVGVVLLGVGLRLFYKLLRA